MKEVDELKKEVNQLKLTKLKECNEFTSLGSLSHVGRSTIDLYEKVVNQSSIDLIKPPETHQYDDQG